MFPFAVGALVVLTAPGAAPTASKVPQYCPAQLASHARTYAAEVRTATESVAAIWPVPPALVKAVIHRESSFHPRAVSRAGAIGLMQVMPWNARRLGFAPAELWEPSRNILAGTRLLAVLLRHYRGDVISALVAYNARPRRALSPVPKNRQTAQYVQGVLVSWTVFQRCEKRAAAVRSRPPHHHPRRSVRRGGRSTRRQWRMYQA